MNTTLSAGQESIWTRIEAEKRRDRVIRRISITAWSITVAVLLLFTAMIGVEVYQTLERLQAGVGDISTVIRTLMPLVTVIGIVSLLVAVLSTVGVFFRLRTASLSEIQLRLAALEEMFVSRSTSADSDV